MEKIKKILLLLVLSQSFAKVTCDDLPGLWWGDMHDEMHLMLDDAMPVVFKIEKKSDTFIGQFQLKDDVPGISSRLWKAKCDQGELTQVFLVDPKAQNCGIQSKDIVLGQTLEMTLNWQNAMMDTTLKVDLVPLKTKFIEKPNVIEHQSKTCH